MNQVKSSNFAEADITKQKLIKLKKIEKEKGQVDFRSKYQDIRVQTEKDQKQELDNFNKAWDEKQTALNELFNRQESGLKETRKQEIEKINKDFDENYPAIKLSSGIAKLQKILEQFIKKTLYCHFI